MSTRLRQGSVFAAVLAMLAFAATALPVAAGIVPADRMTAWAPGIPGGIPLRTTVCATVNASTYGNGSVDASSGIQAAVNACPAGQVVLLTAGNFIVNNLVLINKGITLRGAGAGTTILTKTNGARARTSPMLPVDPSSYSFDAQPVIVVGPSRWPKIDLTSQNLGVDGAKGSNSITVSNASGFSAGQFAVLDELSGASWQSTPTNFPDNGNTSPATPVKVWRGDKVAWNMHLPVQTWQDDNSASNASGPYDTTPGVPPDAMSWFARTDRPTNEVKEIASVSGNTIVFTTPLHIDYRTSHTAQVTGYSGSNALVKDAGVENLSVYGGADGQIRFENAAYSWAKGIENTQWIGEGFAVNGSFRIEIRDSYIHDGSWPEPGGAGYAISFAAATAEVLVENNIIINACKVMVARSSGAGSVFGYNYTDDSWDFDTPTWVEVGLNASHMAGPHHVLFEGNYSPNADSDYTHGNAIDLTFFRNWLTGQRRSFTDGSNIRAVGLAYGSWWDSFVGNVLGRSGQMGGWNYADPAMSCDASGNNCTGNNGNWGDSDIWKLGYDPERWAMNPDPLTLSTVIRDGNFDYLTNTVHWHNTPGGFTLPSSLYLASKPAFFGTATWPWVDATGATKLYILPAKARYDAGTPFAPPPGGPPPPPASIVATAGAGQSTSVSTAFATALQATVKDAANGPVSGVTVTFTLPSAGASGTFAGGATTAAAMTNASGVATTPVITANAIPGSYAATAAVTGVATAATFSLQNVAAAPSPVSAVSRKVHGAAGTFDLPLSMVTTNPTTEPRQSSAATIVMTFGTPIVNASAAITEGTATAGAPTFDGNDVIVSLTGVADQQYVTISLTNVSSASTTGGSGSVRIGFLVGDVNQSRAVSVGDLVLTNAQLGLAVGAANFLRDVSANGLMSVGDLVITNLNLGKGLAAP